MSIPCINQDSLLIDENKGGDDIPVMIVNSTVTSKNQTTLPKAVVKALGVKPSDQLVYEIGIDQVVVRARIGRLADLLASPPQVPPPKRPFTVGQINEAIHRTHD